MVLCPGCFKCMEETEGMWLCAQCLIRATIDPNGDVRYLEGAPPASAR